ncbi:MAG: PAS domain-containing sensor histidine kinase [Chloroflexota bacterium]|nr:PAS domain-containing sensor histidine kinase [Chloroflexota bacterium]
MAEALRPIIEALRRGEALRDVEVELQGRGRRVLSFSGSPLPETGETLSGGVLVFRDVTGPREVERLKDDVLSIASHDLRTPLTVIQGFAELLRLKAAAGPVDGELLHRGLLTIEGQANRLEEWLRLLLDLTRMKGGQVAIEPGPTDLVPLAKAVMEGVRVTTNGRLLELRAPPRVEGTWDARRLEQVLQNLITNALKYSPQDGRVEVAIRADDRTATVSVRDEGVGLAPDELPHIFERFYRAKGIRQIEGSGLGLYICQAIVTAHGGRIWAESRGLGSGSTFCVTLPRGESAVEIAPLGGRPGEAPVGTPVEETNAFLA